MGSLMNVAKMGLNGLTDYGKLIGKSKSGTEVYEQIFNNKRILNAVKDGKHVKQVVQEKLSNGDRIVSSQNFVTGDDFMRWQKKDGSLRVTKGNSKMFERFEVNGRAREYIQRDLNNSKTLNVKNFFNNEGYTVCAGQYKDKKRVPYQLTENITLPSCSWIHPDDSNNIDRNLSRKLYAYFNDMFNGLIGKSKQA